MAAKNPPTREEFYRDKQVVREEWFVHEGDLVSWSRLRVFSDGTADVWEHGELWGFVNEACARFSIREGRYVHPSRLASVGETPLSQLPQEQADANDQHFHWGGDWCTGLAEPGAAPDPAAYLLFPVDSYPPSEVMVAMEEDIRLNNFCSDLVSLKEYEPFVLRLLTSSQAGEWVRVEEACATLGLTADGVGSELFAAWLVDPLGDEVYGLIVFYDNGSLWSMTARYNRQRLLEEAHPQR